MSMPMVSSVSAASAAITRSPVACGFPKRIRALRRASLGDIPELMLSSIRISRWARSSFRISLSRFARENRFAIRRLIDIEFPHTYRSIARKPYHGLFKALLRVVEFHLSGRSHHETLRYSTRLEKRAFRANPTTVSRAVQGRVK